MVNSILYFDFSLMELRFRGNIKKNSAFHFMEKLFLKFLCQNEYVAIFAASGEVAQPVRASDS